MKNKRMLRILALVVVLSMIFTTAAFATPGNKQFKRDVENYKVAFNYLIEKEIMKGYGHGEYGLEGNVKRGDVIVMIVRAFDLDEDFDVKEHGDNFLDLVGDDYMYAPVGIAKKLGIAKGDGLYFKPNKPVTVQEAIWLIERAADLVEDDNLNIKGNDLEGLFEKDELNKFAKRKDIALMLHYVLTGETEEDNTEDDKIEKAEDLDLIKYSMNENTMLYLSEGKFEDFITEVEFDQPDEKEGTLYYDKDIDKDIDASDGDYEIDDQTFEDDVLEHIVFVPAVDFTGKLDIEYTAEDNDNNLYTGEIRITVKEVQEIDTLVPENSVKENSTAGLLIDFYDELNDLTDEYEIFTQDVFDDIDHVKFELPAQGKLYINMGDGEGYVAVDDNDEYELDEIYGLKYVPVKDSDNVTDTVEIEFTALDDNKEYDGVIEITVTE